jgi:hypothetical protein
MREMYDATDYHKPSDEVKPGWDLTGMAADARLLFRVGVRVATGATWPESRKARNSTLSARRAFEDVEAMAAWLTTVSLRHMNT